MAQKPPAVSAFEIVLSEEQLEDLGKFTAIISQIDTMMFQVIAYASKTQTQDLMAIIEGTTSGQRLAMLRRLITKMSDGEIRRKAEDACSGLGRLNDKRNHILHGVWGLLWNTEKHSLHPACVYERNKESPIYATQLPELCDRAAGLSIKVMDLLKALNPLFFSRGDPPHRFLLAAGPPPNRDPPEWRPQPSRRSSPPNPNPDPAK